MADPTLEDLSDLPTNLEAEQELLGAMLLDNVVVRKHRTDVGPEDFADARHGTICRRVYAIVERGGVANPVTLKAAFDADGTLEGIGGTAYLAHLARSATTVANAGDYAVVVRDLAKRRAAIEAARELIRQASAVEVDQPAGDVIAAGVVILQEIASNMGTKIRTGRSIAQEVVANLSKPLPCYPTGLRLWDRAMEGGLYAGRLYGVVARKKIGKSILAGSVSLNLMRQSVPHLYVALEMGAPELMERQMAACMGRSSKVFRVKGMREDPSVVMSMVQMAGAWGEEQLFADVPGATADDVKALIEQAIAKHSIRGAIIDYVQLIGGQPRNVSQAEHLDRLTQWMAAECKRRGIWMLVMAQENQTGNVRGGEGLRLACDQAYRLDRNPDGMGDIPKLAALTMLDTRYTEVKHVGEVSDDGTVQIPGLWLDGRGPIFVDPDQGGMPA